MIKPEKEQIWIDRLAKALKFVDNGNNYILVDRNLMQYDSSDGIIARNDDEIPFQLCWRNDVGEENVAFKKLGYLSIYCAELEYIQNIFEKIKESIGNKINKNYSNSAELSLLIYYPENDEVFWEDSISQQNDLIKYFKNSTFCNILYLDLTKIFVIKSNFLSNGLYSYEIQI